jgi:site-specific recombinase XerD
LATNLHELGVPDKVIQAILRHEDVKTTQKSYIKTMVVLQGESISEPHHRFFPLDL